MIANSLNSKDIAFTILKDNNYRKPEGTPFILKSL